MKPVLIVKTVRPALHRDIHLSVGDRLVIECSDTPVLRAVPFKIQ